MEHTKEQELAITNSDIAHDEAELLRLATLTRNKLETLYSAFQHALEKGNTEAILGLLDSSDVKDHIAPACGNQDCIVFPIGDMMHHADSYTNNVCYRSELTGDFGD